MTRLKSSAVIHSYDDGTSYVTVEDALASLRDDLTTDAQGRLTLATATPIMTSSQSGKTTVYYTPYAGQRVPLYNGTNFVMTDTGGEISQTTTDTTKSPAAVANNSNYDLFAWDDSNTKRCTRGPAWTSDTARGAGAGTTELVRINGVLLNANAITNGPAAQRGTYVGTVRSNGSAQIDWTLPGSNTAGRLCVWNAYNRVLIQAICFDATASYTYTIDTFRQANASANNQIAMVAGLSEDGLLVDASHGFSNTTGNIVASIGIGIDSTSVDSSTAVGSVASVANNSMQAASAYAQAAVPLGFHTYARLEKSQAAGTCTFFGAVNFLKLSCRF